MGVQFDIHPLVFPKIYFLERGWEPVFFFCFFYYFNIIISHVCLENVIKIPQVAQKIWRFSPSILTIFINFLDFLKFPYYKETNGVTDNKWRLMYFYFQPSLNCLILLTFIVVLNIVTWVKISLKYTCSQEEIVQSGNAGRKL